jgi:hypothetical protein
MSDLPDLDSSQISFIAFFNAIDQGGVQSIDPTEVTNHGNVQSYTLYDNGVEGVYTTTTGRDCAFRVKEDGWFVAWFNRYENFNNGQNGNPDNLRGPWDLLNDWVSEDYADDVTQNSLERCINALKGELSNSGSVTYSASDVGLYDYRYSSAAGITVLSSLLHNDDNNGTDSKFPGLQYTSGTTVHWAAAVGTAEFAYDDGGGRSIVDFNGTNVTSIYNVGKHHGAIDLISRGLISNADTEYTGKVEVGYVSGGDGVLSCLLVWE